MYDKSGAFRAVSGLERIVDFFFVTAGSLQFIARSIHFEGLDSASFSHFVMHVHFDNDEEKILSVC